MIVMKKCPYCKNELQQVAQKLICISDDCSFQCKVDEYDYIDEPWGEKISKNNELWNYEVFDNFPYMIAAEYKRLHILTKDNKLYGVMFQIKDFFEILLKFPVLLVLSRYCDNINRNKNQSDIVKFLLENKLSLGHWKVIADKCLAIEDNSPVIKILEGIVKLYDSENITNWRNNTIGHGVLQFDDNEDFRTDIENKILVIKKYLDKFNDEYKNLNFGYKNKKYEYRLQGVNSNLKNLNDKSKLYFYYEDKFVEVNNLIIIHEKEIYFFDSYYKDKKKTKIFNYVNAKVFQKKIKYFEDLFNNISKEVKVSSLINSSSLNDDIYMSYEEEVFNQIEVPNQIIKPQYLYNWLSSNINTKNKGIFLLKMEEGMGKTLFSKLLDPHSNLSTSGMQKFHINNATVRVYNINNMYSYKIDVFRNNLIDMLRCDDKGKISIKGNIPSFREKDADKKKKEFVDILEKFKNIYKSKFGTDKLVLILDGLDEIDILEEETILDYIPSSEILNDDIYVLLTARSSNNIGDIYTKQIESIKRDDTLVVDRNNEEYIKNLREFLNSKCGVNKNIEVDNILQIINNKFVYIKPIQYVLKYREADKLKGMNESLFYEFIDVIKELYTDKYSNNFLSILLILAISRKNLTIEDVSYMLSGENPDFKFIAYLSDCCCLLTKDRSYRGNTIGIFHRELREYLLDKYENKLKEMSREWLNDILGNTANYDKIEDGRLFLIFNSIYISKNYNKEYMNRIIRKFSIDEISKYLSKDKKKFDFELLVTFCNDYIEVIEEEIQKKGCKKNIDRLIDMYIYKIQMILNFGINSDVSYSNEIDRVFELLKLNDVDDINKITKAYELRSNYYTKIGNVKKSMDDINQMAKIISNIENNDTIEYQVSNLAKANIKFQKAINLKNLGDIDNALILSNEALDLIKDDGEKIQEVANKSNILNNIGLCYRTKGDLEKAKSYILQAIDLGEEIRINKEIYNSIIYSKYANLGQILRKQGKLEESLKVYDNTINTINLEEKNGYIVSNTDKYLLYNARANIYWDIGKKTSNNEFYTKALNDYIASENIVEMIDKNNRNMIFLSKLYSNIAKLYKYYFSDEDSAQKYINKFYEVRRELFKKQLDITDINEEDLDRKILLNDIQMSISKAEEAFSKRHFEEAVKLYQEALDILENSNVKEDYDYIRSDLYYNKATCRKSLLQQKVDLNFSLKNKGIRMVENYDDFKPNEIINEFLMADKFILNTNEHKSEIYIQISYIYCEAVRNYEKSKEYAYKGIETGVGLDAAYLMLGNCFFEEEDYGKAIENYKKVSSNSIQYKTAQDNIRVSEYRI